MNTTTTSSPVKTARLMVEAVSVWCPHCNEFLSDPDSGSSILSRADDAHWAKQAGKTVKCFSCGERFRLPARLATLAD